MTRESWSERAIPGFITIFFFFSPSVFFLSFFFYSTYVVWTRDCCIFPSWRRVSRTRRRRRVARFGPAGCQHAVKATLLEPEWIMQTSWYLERKKRMSKTRRLGMDIKSHQFSSLFPSMMMMILFLSLSLSSTCTRPKRDGEKEGQFDPSPCTTIYLPPRSVCIYHQSGRDRTARETDLARTPPNEW